MSQRSFDSPEIAASVFTTAERLVIDYWLEHPNETPEPGTPVTPALSALGFDGTEAHHFELPSAAVARMALAAVEDRLPQCGFVSGDDITFGRDVRSAHERHERRVQLRSRFLFSLDWAATAPGISWPRDYYATWFPGYGIWVVTASVDSNDLWGVLDVSVGWFQDTQQFDEGVHEVIVAHWRRDEWLEPDGAWEYFWEPGLVSEPEARAWREEVWPEPVFEEDEYEDDDVVEGAESCNTQ